MYYRRKIMLALIEAFGGSMDSTDFEKLLFLYCRKSGQNFYDFFPYKFGCFSFVSYQDKRVLSMNGVLSDSEKFMLAPGLRGFVEKLKPQDKEALTCLKDEMSLRGEALVRKVYREYPYYASRSEILDKILSKADQAKVIEQINTESAPCLFTLGYEGITIDAYIDKLIAHNIALVADVRKNPLSMKYGFSKTKFKNYLEKAGIAYEHIPALGIDSELRKNLDSQKDYAELFELYRNEILPRQDASIETLKLLLKRHKRIALTCFEAHHASCHRHKITELLEKDESVTAPIRHI